MTFKLIKKCKRCNKWMKKLFFHADHTRKDGLHPICIYCRLGANKKPYKG